MAQVYVGTSGWMYKHWGEIFYPKDIKGRQLLKYYAERFDSVEINSTFYRIPKKVFAQNWAKTTPDNFVFAVKMNNYLTHTKRLILDEKSLQKLEIYVKVIEGLGDKLKVILVQLPPSSKVNLKRLDVFLTAIIRLTDNRFKIACEFRHESWLTQESYDVLEKHKSAFVIATHPSEFKRTYPVTADFTYIRYHSSEKHLSFANKELDKWAKYINDLKPSLKSIYVYFNDDIKGYAIENANYLKHKLHY